MRNIITLFFWAFLLTICSCNKETSNVLSVATESETIALKYAEGFAITDFGTYKELVIKNPWQDADRTYTYAIVTKENAAKITFPKDAFDAILMQPLDHIVVTSTTHIPFLELLEEENSLAGFPGCDYISSAKTRARINANKVEELGSNEGINTEILLELQPQAIITFGVNGVNKSLAIAEKANIPVIYNGDWMETSALAKAEWIKFFGILFNKMDQADRIFNSIEKDYLDAKDLAQGATKKPTILCGAMHRDVWYLPNGKSPEAQFLKDANTNYLWQETTGNGSLALSIEKVIERAKDAEIWMSPSYYESYDALKAASEHYALFNAFQNKNIYTFSNTKGETGGVLYYELGVSRPDLVLKDMIKICHPELLPQYETTFFKPL